MEHNRIIPTKPILDEKLKEKLKVLSFVQYGNFKDFKDYKMVILHITLKYLVILQSIN